MDVPNGHNPFGAGGSLSSFGLGSQAAWPLRLLTSATGSSTIGANIVIYVPIIVGSPMSVFGMMWLNGSAVSGNIDAGIMDIDGNRLAHIGSTAQSGTSTIQSASFGTALVINPNVYYLAITLDNGTGALNRASGVNAQSWRNIGVTSETTGAFGVPVTWSPGGAQGSLPYFAAAYESSTF